MTSSTDGLPTQGEQYEQELKDAMPQPGKYYIGFKHVAIFGGTELWPILQPGGKQICMVIGPRSEAENLVDLLNQGVK